jgi:hypothetical protein
MAEVDLRRIHDDLAGIADELARISDMLHALVLIQQGHPRAATRHLKASHVPRPSPMERDRLTHGGIADETGTEPPHA